MALANFIAQADLNAEFLEEIFREASFSPRRLPDGMFQLTVDRVEMFFEFDSVRRLNKIVSTMHFKPGVRFEKKLALANRVHTKGIAVRCGINRTHPDYLFVDWYLPTSGGVTREQIVDGVRFFRMSLQGVWQEFDTDDILL